MKGKIINNKYKVLDSILVEKTFSNWIKGSGDQVSAVNVTKYLCENIETHVVHIIDPADINVITEL